NAWLFNYSGQPWLTQQWVRTICNEFYGTEALHGYGVGQDEDQGQLGAWYVMAAMGLFDVQGHASARPSFQFGSPLFDKIKIQLDQDYYPGKELIIETVNQQPDHLYVQSVSWNGEPIENNWVYRDILMQGGTLQFQLGPTPNMDWGVGTPPPSMSKEK
ncbi:MAG: glycoside hydrolase family 92 protein, partial [Lewinella sp.]|nr:glycoside hydrolase family 92 protein [Lewinella sp.]